MVSWNTSTSIKFINENINMKFRIERDEILINTYLLGGDGIFTTKADLITAIDAWIEDDTAATTTYGDINTWDVSAITDFSYLFDQKAEFNSNISNWDVSSGDNMRGMFKEASIFNQDISEWNVSKVTDMSFMFYKAEAFNQDISTKIINEGESNEYKKWDVSQVKDFTSMFWQAKVFDQNIGSWDVSSAETMKGMFNVAEEFNQDIGNWNVTNVTDMSDMFWDAKKFNQNINTKVVNQETETEYIAWNTTNVENMGHMFQNADVFNSPIDKWNMSNVTNTSYMFRDTIFNQDISTKVILEADSPTGQEYTAWDVSKVYQVSLMFYNASKFDQDISSWQLKFAKNDESDKEYITKLNYMFWGAKQFNQDITRWNTENVTSFTGMFYSTQNFDQDISTKIINEGESDEYTAWNVSNGVDFSRMFWRAEAFNQDIRSWDVGNGDNFSYMFSDTVDFNQDISKWKVDADANLENMFLNSSIDENNTYGFSVPDPTYDQFNQLPTLSEVSISPAYVKLGDDVTATFTSSEEITDVTIKYSIDNGEYVAVPSDSISNPSENNWVVIRKIVEDDPEGLVSFKINFTDLAGNAGATVTDTTDGSSSTIYVNDGAAVFSINGTLQVGNTLLINEDSADPDGTGTLSYFWKNSDKDTTDLASWSVIGSESTYTIASSDEGKYIRAVISYTDGQEFSENVITNSVFIPYVNDDEYDYGYGYDYEYDGYSIVNDNDVFTPSDRQELDTAINYWITNETSAIRIYGDINTWDVSGITNMNYLFMNNTTFNSDISNWDVSNVKNMSGMFYEAAAFNQDIGQWNVSNVTDMSGMFYGAKAFNQDINTKTIDSNKNLLHFSKQSYSAWDVSSVNDMKFMFYLANDFSSDLGLWDVSNVSNMNYMFYNAHDFNSNIRSWDVSSVKYMRYMFSFALSFNQNINIWKVRSDANLEYMFEKCGIKNGDYDFSVPTPLYSQFNQLNDNNIEYDYDGYDYEYDIGGPIYNEIYSEEFSNNLCFRNGGLISFKALADNDVNIFIKFKNSSNNDELELGPYTINSTILSPYEIKFPPVPPNNELGFDKVIFYTYNSNVEIQNVVIKEIHGKSIIYTEIFSPNLFFQNGGTVSFNVVGTVDDSSIMIEFQNSNNDKSFGVGPINIDTKISTSYNVKFPPAPPGNTEGFDSVVIYYNHGCVHIKDVVINQIPILSNPINIVGVGNYKNVELNWNPPEINNGSEIEKYRIYVYLPKNLENKYYEVEHPNTNITIYDLWQDWSDSFTFKITAFNNNGEGYPGLSNEVTFTEPVAVISGNIYEGGEITAKLLNTDVQNTIKWRLSKNENMTDYTYLKDLNFTSNNTYITTYLDGQKVSIPKDVFGNNDELLNLDLLIDDKKYDIEELLSSDEIYYYLKLSPEFEKTNDENFYTVTISSKDIFTSNQFPIPNDQSLVDYYIQAEFTISQDNEVYLSNSEKIENVDDKTIGILAFIGNLDLGEMLIADITNISDEDGELTFSNYQWEISNDNINYKSINGANSNIYTIPCSKIYYNKYFRLRVTTTDKYFNRTINYSDPDYLSDYIGTNQYIKTSLYNNLSSESKEELHYKIKSYYADILNVDNSFINISFENADEETISINIKIYSITQSKKSLAFIINLNITDISVRIVKILYDYCNDVNLIRFKKLKIMNYGDNTPNAQVSENQFIEINLETGCCDI